MCRTRKSIACGSIFEKAKLSLATACHLMYFFATDTSVSKVSSQYLRGIVSKTTIIAWYDIFRNAISSALLRRPVRFTSEVSIFCQELEEESAEGRMLDMYFYTVCRQRVLNFFVLLLCLNYCQRGEENEPNIGSINELVSLKFFTCYKRA
jgi:hypothetical protein